MVKPSCNELSVDLGDALDTVKSEIKQELREELEMESMHRMTGLGNIKLVPSAGEFSAVEFGAGIITIPAVSSFLVKLAAMPKMIADAGIHPAISRGVFFGVTTIANLLTGGKSFLTGAMVGQVPGLLDTLADWGVSKIGAPAMAGIGQTSEEEELRKLRSELERLSGTPESELHKEWDMNGLREDDARIRLEAVDSAEGSAEVMEPMTRRAMSGRDVMVVR